MSDATVYPDTAPFTDWMGVTLGELGELGDGEVTLRLDQRHDLNNRRGVVHGGVLATLLDSAMARAARTLDGGLELSGTVDLHVQFMRTASGALTCRGWVTSSTRGLAFCRGEVRDEGGELCASGSATQRLRRPA